VPGAKEELQVVPQVMPAGKLVMVPLPLLLINTVNAGAQMRSVVLVQDCTSAKGAVHAAAQDVQVAAPGLLLKLPAGQITADAVPPAQLLPTGQMLVAVATDTVPTLLYVMKAPGVASQVAARKSGSLVTSLVAWHASLASATPSPSASAMVQPPIVRSSTRQFTTAELGLLALP